MRPCADPKRAKQTIARPRCNTITHLCRKHNTMLFLSRDAARRGDSRLVHPAQCGSQTRDVERADFPRLRRKPYRGVGGAKSLVIASLHDLEKKPFVENVGVDLEKFTIA